MAKIAIVSIDGEDKHFVLPVDSGSETQDDINLKLGDKVICKDANGIKQGTVTGSVFETNNAEKFINSYGGLPSDYKIVGVYKYTIWANANS